MTFINRFLSLTSHSIAPEIFRRWTAISMIASAMGRGVHTTISEPDGPIYPNFYTILVGPPGSGKTVAAINGRRLLKKIPTIHTGPDKITPERLVSNLARMSKDKGYAIMTLFVDELNVLLQRKGDLDLRPLLTGVYNCPDEFIYETEGKGEQLFEKCCFNILATTQPTWIAANFTMEDLGMGFPSRLFFIHSDEIAAPSYFANYTNQDQLTSELVTALKEIEMFKGAVGWEPEAQEFFVKLTSAGIPPLPSAPHLEHYCSRRDLHLTKLSLIMMRARDPRAMQIKKDDIVTAMTTMLEAEATMPTALNAIGGNQFRVAQTYLLAYVQKQIREKHPSFFSGQELHRLLTANLTPRESKELLESLISQGLCEATGDNPMTAGYKFHKARLAAQVRSDQSRKPEEKVH